MTLTREQIEAIRDDFRAGLAGSKEIAADVRFSAQLRAAAERAADRKSEHITLCPLALQALDMRWRPIEEAPKDDSGTCLLANAHHDPDLTPWELGWYDNTDGQWVNDSTSDRCLPATHFIPLSALPAPEATT